MDRERLLNILNKKEGLDGYSFLLEYADSRNKKFTPEDFNILLQISDPNALISNILDEYKTKFLINEISRDNITILYL